MSTQAISFHAKSDKDLRSRVKLLGKLVGNVLLKHEGPEVFHAVELEHCFRDDVPEFQLGARFHSLL